MVPDTPFTWLGKTSYNLGVDLGAIFKGRTSGETEQLKLATNLSLNPVKWISEPIGNLAVKLTIFAVVAFVLVYWIDRRFAR
jgi:hypothetical protein